MTKQTKMSLVFHDTTEITQSGAKTNTAAESVSFHSLSRQAALNRNIVTQNSQSTG